MTPDRIAHVAWFVAAFVDSNVLELEREWAEMLDEIVRLLDEIVRLRTEATS